MKPFKLTDRYCMWISQSFSWVSFQIEYEQSNTLWMCWVGMEKTKQYCIWWFVTFFKRATPSVLTSGREKKYVISPSNLNLAVRWCHLGFALSITPLRYSQS